MRFRFAPQVNVFDRFNVTPLDDAIRVKNKTIAQMLKEKGATSGRSKAELTAALAAAAATGNLEDLSLLVDYAGADVNARDSVLRTALHVAAAEGQVAAVEFLIKNGADVNAVDRYGNTPLMEAKRGRGRGSRAVVQVLQENNAAVRTAVVSEASLQSSLTGALPYLCDRGNFVYVETWLPTKDSSEFVSSEWYAKRDYVERLTVVREHTSLTEFINNPGPLATAMEAKKPVMVPDIATAQMPSRYRAFVEAGIKSCVIIPIVHNGTVVAGLKLFSAEPIKMTEEELAQFAEFTNNMIDAGVYGATKTPKFRPVKDIPPGQMEEVFKYICEEGVFSPVHIYHEVDWFYNMGLQVHYFRRFSSRILANHIHSWIAAKKFAATTGVPENIWLHIENNPRLLGGSGPEQALYMVPCQHNTLVAVERGLERRIALIPPNRPYTLEYFQSASPHVPGTNKLMGIYVLETNHYVNPSKIGNQQETNIWEIASDAFLRDKTKLIRERYQEIIKDAAFRLSPVARVYETYRDGTIPIMFAFHHGHGTTASYMLQLTELLKQSELVPVRKFIETFANGMIVFSLYLKPCPQHKIDTLLKQFSLLHLVPKSPLTPNFLSGAWTAEEYTYSSAAARFIYYFINQRSEEFDVLSAHLKNDPINLGRLRLLHTSLKREAVSQNRIYECLLSYAKIVEELFKDFHQRITTNQLENPIPPNDALRKLIKTHAQSVLDETILTTMLIFNEHVLKTNFYKRSKSALSFRLDPKFLAGSDWPQIPYGVFFVLGSDFQGFHIRFEDISRGGIRLIKSRDPAAYAKNHATLFQENYGLAYTQNKKNKDIPEFGSKGTVLLHQDTQSQPRLSFQKYVSGILDLIIPHKDVVDNYGKPELLFFGPDEGTADYMEWAARYAERKGYPYWRAITTGKPRSLGGIPHDKYGMTTTSVHRYVLGCLRKLGLDETQVTKVQTGGPDGDLGSNEILISKDKTIAVIDGSGVLYDPEGINREELVRLAKLRVMIKDFDTSKLSPKGFKVLITDTNVMLPHGELVESGLAFRNEFHLHPLCTADLFVPCGGRPESVNLGNVKHMFTKDGKPKFKIIVEGANLFFTQDARMVLEEAGVILYKDASTNKGGVTSSSLEVLACLALDDNEFNKHMAVTDPDNPPQFYEEYVKEIKKRIENDAELEFERIWQEHERTGKFRYLLTDEISEKITNLTKVVSNSGLWDNVPLRMAVLEAAIPQKLQQLKPLPQLMQRLPEVYAKAIFSSYLASRYVYKYGLASNEFSFFEFMQPFIQKIPASHAAAAHTATNAVAAQLPNL